MIPDPSFNAEEALKNLQQILDSNTEQLKAIYDRHHAVDDEDVDKKISCTHELVFTIKAKALEENEKGETIRCKEVCVKNYHIPVPLDQDYNIFMDNFFKYLEKCIGESARHSYGDNNDV